MTVAALTVTALAGFPTVCEGDDPTELALASMDAMGLSAQDGNTIVFAQKIISKGEGRTAALEPVEPSAEARSLAAVADIYSRLVELNLREWVEVVRARPGVRIVEDRRGFVMANTGIDASNVEDRSGWETVLLLPTDPGACAERIGARVKELSGIEAGVIINDSFGRAWRLGTVGTAVGVAGIPALIDLRGRLDRNGRPLQTSELAAAEEVAAAASLVMGQADEGRPAALVRGFPYTAAGGRAAHLTWPRTMDLFR